MIYDLLPEFASHIPKQGSILSLDFGLKRIGVAKCDPERIISSPVEVYLRRNNAKDLGYLARIARDNQIIAIIIGLPLNLDGSHSDMCEIIKNFAGKLNQRTSLPILLFDERFSTKAVTKDMIDAGVKRAKRHEVDDKLAACYILQSVMEMLKRC